MGDDTYALGRRAIAVPGWRWLPDMLAISDAVPAVPPERLTDRARPNWPNEHDWPHDLGLRVPDLSDPQTAAKALEVVRSMYPGADGVGAYRAFHSGQHYVRIDRSAGRGFIHGATVAEALVRALENAAVEAGRRPEPETA